MPRILTVLYKRGMLLIIEQIRKQEMNNLNGESQIQKI
jgi:hypothetical protein